MQGSLDPFQRQPHPASKRCADLLPVLHRVPNVAGSRRALTRTMLHIAPEVGLGMSRQKA